MRQALLILAKQSHRLRAERLQTFHCQEYNLLASHAQNKRFLGQIDQSVLRRLL